MLDIKNSVTTQLLCVKYGREGRKTTSCHTSVEHNPGRGRKGCLRTFLSVVQRRAHDKQF